MIFDIKNYSQKIFFSKNILYFVVFSLLVVSSGCSQQPLEQKNESGVQNIQEPKEKKENISQVSFQSDMRPQSDESTLKKIVKKERENLQINTTDIVLKIVEEDKDSVLLEVSLLNPEQEEIQSLQAWFLYPPSILKGVEINIVSEKIFDLVAPAEKEFDVKNGIAKIGVSTSGKGMKTPDSLVLAHVLFKKKNDSPFQFEFFETNTQVMSLTENGVRNILK